MLMLYPLLAILLVVLWIRLEQRRQRAYVKHPDRPWNVTARAAREAMDWQRAECLRQRKEVSDA